MYFMATFITAHGTKRITQIGFGFSRIEIQIEVHKDSQLKFKSSKR